MPGHEKCTVPVPVADQVPLEGVLCRLYDCRHVFVPRRRWQEFCTEDCRKEFDRETWLIGRMVLDGVIPVTGPDQPDHVLDPRKEEFDLVFRWLNHAES